MGTARRIRIVNRLEEGVLVITGSDGFSITLPKNGVREVDLSYVQLDRVFSDNLSTFQDRGIVFVYLDDVAMDSEDIFNLRYPSVASEDEEPGEPGSDFTYTNATAMSVAVGGWEAGSTFEDHTLQELFDGLFYPYQYPTFSSFSMSGQSSTLEVGDSSLVDPTFTWGTTNSTNVASNSISLLDITGGTTLASGLANSGTSSVTLAAVTKTFSTSHTFRVSGVDTRSNAFTRNLVFTWYWRVYRGESAETGPLNQTQIKALSNSALGSSRAGNYVFSAGGYKYISYPTTFGLATSFKDSSTQLDVSMESPYTVSVENAYGVSQDYYVYRTTNVLGSAITITVV